MNLCLTNAHNEKAHLEECFHKVHVHDKQIIRYMLTDSNVR